MAQKKTTKSISKKTVKKSINKNKDVTKKTLPKKKQKKKIVKQHSLNPLFVLFVMVLITVIFLLVNRMNQQKPITNKSSINTSNELKHKSTKSEEIKKTNEMNKISKEEDDENEQIDKANKRVKIYFIKMNEKSEKIYLSSVRRYAGADQTLKDTLKKLIKGPTAAEKNNGYLTAVPSSLRMRSVTLKNRIAVIDFDNSIGKGAAGNILISRLDQIVYTATQFNNIDSVIITINGKGRKSLGSDGLSIQGPIHRRK